MDQEQLPKKIALCFIISYKHIVIKEKLWIDWIEPNKDIIHVYFHYKDFSQIKSSWIKKHALPLLYIANTSYFHVVPAYMNLMKFAMMHDLQNQWFCFLTDSCVPILSPQTFRKSFFQYQESSIIKCSPAWWNVDFNKRANLRLLAQEYRLANDPWFILNREDVASCIHYSIVNNYLFHSICSGIIANESIFAIILHVSHTWKKTNKKAINESTHITNWDNMSSSTSPYVFKSGDKREMEFIIDFLQKNKYCMFMRKVDASFPEEILRQLCSL